MSDGQQRFEVVIFNQIVRDLVERDESHRDLKDSWAENHYQEISASDADEARRKMEARYPPAKGFVVAQVIPLTAYDGDDDDASR